MAGGVQYDAVGKRPSDLKRAEMKPEQKINDETAHSIRNKRETPINHMGVRLSRVQGNCAAENRRLTTQRRVRKECEK
jgi:hypothetical protein